MTFTPVNNHLWVRTIEDEETEESGILLPQDYRPADKAFAVVRVLGASMEAAWVVGTTLVVEAQMLRDIEHHDHIYTVVKENYVIGVLS
jgi:co-chaperonin GroES (HSP10)